MRSNAASERAGRAAGAKRGVDSAAELRRLERIAWWLDDAFRIPFTNVRIGLDAVLGLLPWAGDTAAAVTGLLLLASAVRFRVPKVVVLRMAIHVAFDYLIGLVPVVGDASDFFVKSNRWNLDLLRRYAGRPGPPARGDVAFVSLVIVGLGLVLVGGAVLTVALLAALGRATGRGWW